MILNKFKYAVFYCVCLFSCSAYADSYRNESRYIEQLPISAINYDFDQFSTSDSVVLELYGIGASSIKVNKSNQGLVLLDASDSHVELSVKRNALSDISHMQLEAESFVGSTFVLDFEEASVQSLISNINTNVVGFDPVLNTVSYVDAWITKKNRKRGFDIASRVAVRGEGDCTEHSVLLGAIARGLGYPAKVVFGVVIIGFENGVEAFGHAWNEVYVDGRWQLADAALYGLELPAFYVPTGTLDNEGPGFALSLVNSMSRFPKKIVLK